MPRKEEVLLGRYRLVRPLGEGGYAAVWLAEDRRAGATVAVKLLHGHQNRPIPKDRFEREGEVLSTLHHPSIARALRFYVDADPQLLILEYVPGRTLAEVHFERAGHGQRFSLAEVLRITEQIGLALDHAHSLGIVHRDLKPHNVMVCEPEEELKVKILDFGIAKLMEESADRQTTVGRIVGSKFFMAPEQTSSQADPRTDVFALATLVFELLTGRRAWSLNDRGEPAEIGSALPTEENTPVEVLRRIISWPRPKASRYRQELTPALDNLLERSMAVRREERPRSAGAFVEKLTEAFLQAPMDGGNAEYTASMAELDHATMQGHEPSEVELSRVVPSEWTSVALTDAAENSRATRETAQTRGRTSATRAWADTTDTAQLPTPTAEKTVPLGRTRRREPVHSRRGELALMVVALALVAVASILVLVLRPEPAAAPTPVPKAALPEAVPTPKAVENQEREESESDESKATPPQKELESPPPEHAVAESKKASPPSKTVTRKKVSSRTHRRPAPKKTNPEKEAKPMIDEPAAQAKITEVYAALKALAQDLPLDRRPEVESLDRRLLDLRKQLGDADNETIARVYREAIRLHKRIKQLSDER